MFRKKSTFRKTSDGVGPPTPLDRQGKPVVKPPPETKTSKLPGDEPAQKREEHEEEPSGGK